MEAEPETPPRPAGERHRARLKSLGDVSCHVRRVVQRLDRLALQGRPSKARGQPIPEISTSDYLMLARTQVYALKVLGDLMRDVELEARVRQLEEMARARVS